MSVRKLAGLIAGLALAVGLIGGGISAAFTSQVSAVQKITVGSMDCGISTTAAPAVLDTADAAGAHHSVTFTAPEIKSSAADNSPFPFTVTNMGSIPTKVTVTSALAGLSAKFTDMLGSPAAVTLTNNGDSQAYAGGIKWTELDSTDLNTSGSITYTVVCAEV